MGIESPTHLIFIAVVALIVLGPKRLPDLARSLGHGIREFRQSLEDGANSHDPPPAPAPTQTVTPSPQASSPTPTPAPPASPADSTGQTAAAPAPAAAEHGGQAPRSSD
jgi:sec-independent protein translocase protein TatA